MHRVHRTIRRGFTLIELLVVIAIIALLVAILLPALGAARCAARKTVSLSNIRQISAGTSTYREDFKSFMPLVLPYVPRYQPAVWNTPTTEVTWYCTWTYGGKNCDPHWKIAYSGYFDVEAADRPLNRYLYDVSFDAPPPPASMLANDPARKGLQLEVYRDPLDRGSYQRESTNWSSPNPVPVPTTSYDDVGTSYHFNIKWFDPIYARTSGPRRFERAFNFGCNRLRLSDSFVPSRMVWVNDQFADVAANSSYTQLKLKNTCNEVNKSVMGFMDGHAASLPVFPGGGNDTTTRSYQNEFYTFVFDDLRQTPN